RDYSSWGIKIKYWLHGLEATNSNAMQRVVVLHSWEAVSDDEIYPNVSPLSWGCPAVSNEFMEFLDQKLQVAQKPVLLWIIE
ncbi:MAG: murein L,D-transpeptidase catalytic domain-containing protein, partial [Flavobacteriaceae bacterium]